MARLAPIQCALRPIMVSAAFILSPEAKAGGTGLVAAPPGGFEDLAGERQLVVDAYVGGQKVGEAQVRVAPGSLSFDRPDLVAAMVPGVADRAELARLLGGPLPANVRLACGMARSDGCGRLRPDRAAIILDEARFRVDIFVHPDLLERLDPLLTSYLPDPIDRPSLISQFGATVSGAGRGDSSWHVQNRSIASIGRIRMTSDSSLSSGSGLTFDNLALEADRNDWRFAGGLFWAPGTDLIGRRRMVGAGITTQLDTRLDRMTMMATPLIVFLHQPGRVELVVDGRVQSSHIYPAGNLQLDTTNLPNGSYEIVIRVQEDGQSVREERQFFSKGAPIAPAGRPLLSAFAGFIPTTGSAGERRRTPYYQAAAAFRLDSSWGVDAAVVGTDDKAVLEGGVVFLHHLAQVRARALVSSSADHGVLLRASSAGHGPLSFSLDLRTIRSRDGRALLPVTAPSGTFSEDSEAGFADRGSYTQILSILGHRMGSANLRVTGLYRRSGADRSSYSLGVAGDVPVVRSERWNLVFQGDVRKTDDGFSSFMGLRLLANRGRFAYSGSAGLHHASGSHDRSTRVVGEAQASWFHQDGDRNQYTANAAVGRDLDGSYSRASASARLPFVNARADLLRQISDGGGTTQYSAAFDTGFAVGGGRVGVAARERNDAAIMVHVAGGDPDGQYEILVDDVVRGTARDGIRRAVFLEPYRRYEVRLRPLGGLLANVDPAPRQVSLFPGSVAVVEWATKSLFVLFGRAIDAHGSPLANAEISWPNGVGRSDSDGYFQIEAVAGDELRFSGRDGASCAIIIAGSERPANSYLAGGDMMCR